MMSGVVFIILVALAFLIHCEGNEIPPGMLCANPQCSSPISQVRGLHSFASGDKEKLSFNNGQIFHIYGKPAGSNANLWFAEIGGRRGYIPMASVRELKVIHKKDLVPSMHPENPVQEKRNVVELENSVSGAVTSDTVISSTDSYEVVEGTTIPIDALATATPTDIATDAHKETKTLPIEPTSSFLTQYADSNTQSDIQSEMSPISPTTMMEKPEEAESSSSTEETPSESKDPNMIEKFINFVSGKNSSEKDHESQSETPPTEETPSIDNPSQGEPTISDKGSDPKGDATESEQSNDNKETTIDTAEGDSEEDEDDDDEGDEDDDDGGGEEEEEEDDSGDEEPGEANEELGHQIESDSQHDGVEQGSSAHKVEKTVEVVESSYSMKTDGNVGVENSDVGDSYNKSESSKEAETDSQTSENSTSADSEHFMRGDFKDKASEDVHHSQGYSETLPATSLPYAERSTTAAAEQGGDSEGGVLKNPTGTIDQHEAGHSVQGQELHQDSNIDVASQNELKKDVSESVQNDASLRGEEPMPKDEAVTSESPLTLPAEDSPQQSSRDADTKVDMNEESSVTSAEMSGSEPTTVSPHYEGMIPEDNIGISTPPSIVAHEQGTSEEIPKEENLGSEKMEVTAGEHLEPKVDNQLEQKELEEEMKNIDEVTDKSGSESNLSISEESSGIFSMIFLPLSTGYDYMIDAVFGKSDEIEVITDSVSNVNFVGNSDIPDKILNQLEDQKRPLDVEGHTHDGISSNDNCEANPADSYCGKSTSNWPPETERSSEYQESKSWIDNAREEYQNPFDINNPSYYGALLFSTAVGGMLVCFFLGKYYMEGKKSDALLVAKLNALEKKLMVSSTECLILKDKLRNADDSSEIIESLRSEVDKLQNEKTQLEKELEVAAEAGLEMDRMVSQCLSSQQACESLMESIEQLRLQANQQQATTSSLENNLVLKTQENETLAQELKVAEEKIVELSSQLKKVEADLIQKEEEHHEKYDELRKLYDNQKKQYEEDLRNKTVEAVMVLTKCNSLEATLNETKDLLAIKENEIAVLQECLEKIKTSNGEEQGKVAIQFQDMLDFGKLKAELTSVSKERDHLKEELQGEEEARKLLEDHVKVIKEEVEKLRKLHEAAERDKAEAQTRLEVLSSYFKEKESQLQKELGAQIQKYTDASSVVQHMKSLEDEVENYRSQNETLKKEILDQERGYKSQLASIEKKARENWVAARQAERKLDESKQEAGQLRNRLTMLSKTAPQSVSQNGDDSKQNISVMDSNGELSASPLHMGLASNSSVDSLFLDPNASPPLVSGGVRMPPLMPPPPFPPLPPLPPMSPYHHPISPPLPFVPPPPEGIYPQSADGHRPPPLGRMSSPPPPPSPSHSPHLHHANSRPGKYASPFHDRKGERKSASPPSDMYRGMPIDDRGHMDEWGRYRTPPPHSTHLPDYPPFPYPHPRQHWEDDSMPPTSSFRPLPSQAEAVREKKGGKSKDNHPTEMENLEKANRYGAKQ